MAGRGPTQDKINTAMVTTLGNINITLYNLQNNNNNNNHVNHQANAASLIARNKPKVYAGEVDPVILRDWGRQMEKQFVLFEVLDGEKVRIASHYLVRDVDEWWRLIGPTVVGAPGFGWHRFTVMLDERFYPEENKTEQEKFHNCKQGKMSVEEYHDRFHSLVHYAGDVVTNEV